MKTSKHTFGTWIFAFSRNVFRSVKKIDGKRTYTDIDLMGKSDEAIRNRSRVLFAVNNIDKLQEENEKLKKELLELQNGIAKLLPKEPSGDWLVPLHEGRDYWM